MLEPEVTGKTHPRLILDINKTVGIRFFFLERNVLKIKNHNAPVYKKVYLHRVFKDWKQLYTQFFSSASAHHKS